MLLHVNEIKNLVIIFYVCDDVVDNNKIGDGDDGDDDENDIDEDDDMITSYRMLWQWSYDDGYQNGSIRLMIIMMVIMI